MYIIINEEEEIFTGFSQTLRLSFVKFTFEITTIPIAIHISESEASAIGNYIQEIYGVKVSVVPLRQWLDNMEGK